MIHFFKKSVSHIALPEKFTYPFHYTPHPLCVLAAEEVKEYFSSRKEWQEELTLGKMFGVLIVQETGKRTRKGREKETGESTDKTKKAESVTWQPFPAIWQGRICILILFLLFMTCSNHKDSSK